MINCKKCRWYKCDGWWLEHGRAVVSKTKVVIDECEGFEILKKGENNDYYRKKVSA